MSIIIQLLLQYPWLYLIYKVNIQRYCTEKKIYEQYLHTLLLHRFPSYHSLFDAPKQPIHTYNTKRKSIFIFIEMEIGAP